ncbi:MAG: SpoIIE family protein phosphatase [Actinomycetota bacterium]|nr:SpoIIE family protein phosphatase [Actinomycetota bacterium]
MSEQTTRDLSDPLRLRALDRSGLMEVVDDEALGRFTRLACRLLKAPVSLVSLVDERVQHFASAVGLPEPWATEAGTPLSHSFCRHVVASREPLFVEDAREHPLVAENLAIPDLNVIAYAGVPITDETGLVLGSFCVIDHQPRAWTQDELDVLSDLGAAVSGEVQLRLAGVEARDAQLLAARVEERLAVLADAADLLTSTLDMDATVTALAQLAVPRLADCCVIDLVVPGDKRYRTAAITHVDPEGRELFVRAEQVFPRRSNPNSAILRILGGGQPLLLEGVDDAYLARLAVSPEQLEFYRALKPGSSVMVPLRSRDTVLGALTLLRLAGSRPYDESDLALAVELGRRAGLALENARLYEQEHRAAEALQRELLPSLPEVPGLRLAAQYVPSAQAGQVGGDWYDVLTFPDGGVGLAVGDVSGHDLSAAAVMGQIRAVVRAYAWEGKQPGDVLDRTCELVRGLEIDRVATAFYARLEPPGADGCRVLRAANAGHPPVLLLPPGQPPRLLHPPRSLLIGLAGEARATEEVVLEPGSILVFYTDGLVERRDRDLEEGTDELLAIAAGLSPEASVADIAGTLVDKMCAGREDDVAVLVVGT